MASLAGKIIALTGAASGIGAATAKLLASRGAILAIADINKQGLDKTAASLKVVGTKCFTATTVDIRDRNQVRKWLRTTTTELGQLDGAANIAGVAGKNQNIHHIWDLSTDEYNFIMDVNSKGLFHCLAEQLGDGVMKDGSSIASVSSFCGLRGTPRSAAYVASKHAAIGLIKSAALEAGPRNIRVNGVAPGVVNTPMLSAALDSKDATPQAHFTPIVRNAEPIEIAYTLSFLLGDETKFTTGQVYGVDGGWNI